LIAEHLQRTVLLGKYRGRSCYDALVQVADYFARKQTLILDLLGLRHLQTERLSDTQARVTFLATRDGTQHQLLIARDVGVLHTYTSCGAAQATDLDQYRLLSHKVVGA
jgi:hypothetical protein